jgi:hypothetical protein
MGGGVVFVLMEFLLKGLDGVFQGRIFSAGRINAMAVADGFKIWTRVHVHSFLSGCRFGQRFGFQGLKGNWKRKSGLDFWVG